MFDGLLKLSMLLQPFSNDQWGAGGGALLSLALILFRDKPFDSPRAGGLQNVCKNILPPKSLNLRLIRGFMKKYYVFDFLALFEINLPFLILCVGQLKLTQ